MNLLIHTFQTPGGEPFLGILAKTIYRVVGNECRRLPEVPAFVEEPVRIPSANPDASEQLLVDSDLFAPLKPSVDVLVSGTAYSHRGPVSRLDTEVRVGPLHKAIRVHGERRVLRDSTGRIGFSSPEVFERMPISWDRAYGGRDRHAERALRPAAKAFARAAEEPESLLAYPRNPAGRGFFVDVDIPRIHGTPAPNLEDPEDPVTPERLIAAHSLDWLDRPSATCYGPVEWTSFPRVALWLGVDYAPPVRPPVEVRRGFLRPKDLAERSIGATPDPRAYNSASPGLSGAEIAPREVVSLRNMHPKAEHWHFRLPAERPRLVVAPPGCGVFEIEASLKTVRIEPDEDRVTLTWSGALEVAAPYPVEMCRTMDRAVQWSR